MSKQVLLSLALILLAPLAKAASVPDTARQKSIDKPATTFNERIGTPVLSFQIPQKLAAALQQRFPNSTILAHSTQCSDSSLDLLGMIITLDNRLHAILAVETTDRWLIHDLSTDIGYSCGYDPDFLSDFDKGNLEYMQVRCAVPNRDKDISVDANGEFLNGFHERNNSDEHVCFSASAVYNSWACYRMKPSTTKPVLSFVQMNAD